jgi:hypothetical protein
MGCVPGVCSENRSLAAKDQSVEFPLLHARRDVSRRIIEHILHDPGNADGP